MAVWGWVLVAVGALSVVSIVVALAIARLLGQIAADVTELHEGEEWSAAPLTRSLEEPNCSEALARAGDVTELLENEEWSAAPLTRELYGKA